MRENTPLVTSFNDKGGPAGTKSHNKKTYNKSAS